MVITLHEMSIVGEIFSIINENIQKYNLKKVSRVVIAVGEMTCVNDDALQFAFQVFAENTIAENAELIINKVEAKVKCNNCGQLFNITYTDKQCPVCNTYSDNLQNGYELILDKVEGEVDEDN